ncbi:bifunctional lysylphosphatidylglycerol flippase/synthetase MprF [Thioclava sp. GXIMD4215]|uniref:bifunctional lysylphosphatidylglycerol flippase/synthetase MprF n=1 Tax=Thioclava sp. GXIMD4215 TaxID=3131928 RepID=UPI00311AF41F
MISTRLRGAVPYLVTAVLFGLGAFALYRLMAHVSMVEVVRLIRATPFHDVVLAVLCTCGGYAALAGYDWSALRFIGKKLPLAVVLTGSFLGYSIGNTVGAGPVTGGAVRYRIYSAMGLSAFDIAGISLFCSLSFGIGATLIGLGALAWHPHALGAVISVSPHLIRWAAIGIVVLSCGVLAVMSIRKSSLTLRGISLQMPGPALSVGQFFFTAAETILSAATLYILLPADQLGFATFLAVFSAAVMAGVLSHVPGGVGVFETIIVAALPHNVPAQEIAAGLLLYRLIYYILPFALAMILMALGEVRLASRKMIAGRADLLAPAFQAISALAPLAMSAMTFVLGAALMILPLLPPSAPMADGLSDVVPLVFLESGALVSSAIGACLVVLAHGLLRRVSGAWWLTQVALAVGMVASLAHGFDYPTALMLLVASLILQSARGEFYRMTRLTRNVLGLRWFMLMVCLALTILATLFFVHKAVPYNSDLWWQFATDKAAPRALRAALVGFLVMTLLLLRYALRPGNLHAAPANAEEMQRAAAIIARQDDPKANIALSGDKALLFSPSGNSFLMYRIQGGSWVALHEPVGDRQEASGLVWSFHDAAQAAGARPLFYDVPATSAHLWIDMGLALHKLGEEAVVPLERFSLEGSARKRLRTTHARALRDGLRMEVVQPPHSAALLQELRQISQAWLAVKAGAEKGFSVGYFSEAYLQQTPVALIYKHDAIVAFANLWTTQTQSRATIDLMRHLPERASGVMEFLFTELLLHFKALDYQSFSLGNAPLSGLENRRGARLSSQLGAFIYRHGGHFYNFEGLRDFKQKFDPDWEPVYVAVPPRANAIATATDLLTLISGSRPNLPSLGPQAEAPQP